MPVTKKKGAIFEIYADSPLPASSSSSSTSSRVASPADSPAPLSKRTSSSSSNSSSLTRRALGVRQTALMDKPVHGMKMMQNKPSSSSSKKLGVFVDPPKAASSSSSSSKPAKLAVFVDPSTVADRPHALSRSHNLPLGSKTNTGSSNVLKPLGTSTGSSSSSGAKGKMQIFADEPQPLAPSKPKERRPLGSSSTSSSTSTRLGSSRPLGVSSSASAHAPLRTSARTSSSASATSSRMFDIFTDPTPPPAATGNRKRERAHTPVDKENTAPDAPSSRTRARAPLSSLSGVLEPSTSTTGAAAKAAKKPLKGLAPSTTTSMSSSKRPAKAKKGYVLADPALADVSIAYDASGVEPEGFRTQGRGRHVQTS